MDGLNLRQIWKIRSRNVINTLSYRGLATVDSPGSYFYLMSVDHRRMVSGPNFRFLAASDRSSQSKAVCALQVQ